MQEKQKELFDQYDVELLHVRRGRGCLIWDTPNGSYELQKCEYSPKRLEQAFQIKEGLETFGFFHVDQYIRNKEGELLVYDRYQTPFILKRHFDGRECDIRNNQNIKKTTETLGLLHRYLKQLPVEGYPMKQNQFGQKNRELLRTKKYIAKRMKKKNLNNCFFNIFHFFGIRFKIQRKQSNMYRQSVMEVIIITI